MKFAVFITSHGRADRVLTYDALRTAGYTGQIWVVIDDEDDIESYRHHYFSELLVYHKQYCIDKCDTVIPTSQRASVTYPRIFVEEIAKEFKLDAFMVIDDDINSFRYRWVDVDVVRSLSMKHGMDDVLDLYIRYIIDHDIAVTSFVHMMFYIGGVNGLDRRITEQRELTQIFIRNTKFDVDWTGVMRQDMITNLLTSKTGYLWWALPFITYDSEPMNETAEKEGGMIEAYKELNNYNRSFLGVITNPSSLKIGCANNRIKILCDKSTSYPLIVSSRCKK